MSNTFKAKVEERLDGNNLPNFIYCNGELLMPMPDGSFIYFPRGYPHVYLSREEVKELLYDTCGEGKKIYTAGNIRLPEG